MIRLRNLKVLFSITIGISLFFVLGILLKMKAETFTDIAQSQKIKFNALSCGKFPEEQNISREANHWQSFRTSNDIYYFYGAYYDDRELVQPLPVVRILSFVNNPKLTANVLCQLWFEGFDDPIVQKVTETELLWNKEWESNHHYSPYFISCENPINKVPLFVSIVENRCDAASNLLEVYHRPELEKKKNFNVCVKNLNFTTEIADQLIEWMEIMKILGAEKVTIFVVKVPPQTMEVLNFYEAEGFAEIVKSMEYPKAIYDSTKELQIFQMEQICFHDCFYRSFNEFNFIIPLDTDELIIPLKDKNWKDLLERIYEKKNGNFDAYSGRNYYYLYSNETNSKEKVYHFIDNTFRAPGPLAPLIGTKSFFSSETCLVVHNHAPLKCLVDRACNRYDIELKDGQLAHYKLSCGRNPEAVSCVKHNFEDAVNDTTIWRFKEELIRNIEEVSKKIKSY